MSTTRTSPAQRPHFTRLLRVAPRSLCCALFIAVAPELASAETARLEDDRAQARQHFQRGVELGNAGAYGESLREFLRAYELAPHHTVLYNIGQAHIALGHAADAVEVLKRYLSEGGASIGLERRQQVEAEIVEQFARTAALELRVDAANARVTIDGTPRGHTPLPGKIRLDAGEHRVEVTLESGERSETTVSLVGGRDQLLELRLLTAKLAPMPALPPTPASLAPAPPPAAPLTSSANHHRHTALGVALGALGVGLGGAALGHYLWNRGRYHDWQNRYTAYFEDPSPERREDANRLAESIPRASAVTISLAVGAGLALGSGAFVLITDVGASKTTGSVVGWRGAW